MALARGYSPYRYTHVPNQNKKLSQLIAQAEQDMGARITENTLSEEQHDVFSKICAWRDRRGRVLTLGGFAGTGKSTLISVLAGRYAMESLVFSAFTGKATSVLRKKLHDANAESGFHETKTLHSLMYFPLSDAKSGTVTGWKRRPSIAADLIVIDEASMLDARLFQDLQSYEIPILAVGDHGQLPPVSGSFNLMEHPELRLETVHRQAEGSPILALSAHIRKTGTIPRSFHEPEAQVLRMPALPDVLEGVFSFPDTRFEDIGILCYANWQRVRLNAQARRLRWGNDYSPRPKAGDLVVCLKNVDGSIFNGMRGTIVSLDKNLETELHYFGSILFEEEELMVEGPICKAQFNRERTINSFAEFEAETGFRTRTWEAIGLLFDFGYAMTVHKSQGSEFEHAIVIAERPQRVNDDEWRRWLYTGVTRCSKYLVVLE